MNSEARESGQQETFLAAFFCLRQRQAAAGRAFPPCSSLQIPSRFSQAALRFVWAY